MCRILRQIEIRAAATEYKAQTDEGANYRDYILATGETHAVWELVDAAFRLVGLELEWHFETDEPADWRADFSATGSPAVVVDQDFLRVAEPTTIQVDPARARQELAGRPDPDWKYF